MDSEVTSATSVHLLFFIVLVFHCDAGNVTCPPRVYAEMWNSAVIDCNVIGERTDVFWFKGADATTIPILSMEGRDSGGSEYGKGTFELWENNSLVINNATVEIEGAYTIRVYFIDGAFQTSHSSISVYSRPKPPCPIIDVCEPQCVPCQKTIDRAGGLTCYVTGTRPKVTLDWKINNQTNINFVERKLQITQSEEFETWNSSISIEYTPEQCGANAWLECIASETLPAPILGNIITSVHLNTAPCETTPTSNQPNTTSSTTGIIIACVVVAVILFMVACVLKYFFCIKRDKKRILVDCLKHHYNKFCFIKPLPWGHPIPIATLYTNCQCTIINADGNISSTSSDVLFTGEFLKKNNRMLLIADLGYGKTTLTQQIVYQWLRCGTKEYILIYVHLKEVHRKTTLTEVVMKMLPPKSGLTTKDIDILLREFDCHILLDGLDELSMSVKTNVDHGFEIIELAEEDQFLQNDPEIVIPTTSATQSANHNLEIGRLLSGEAYGFKGKLNVWVTSREVDNATPVFPPPFTKVTMNGFSDKQIKDYIKKTCKYYENLNSSNVEYDSSDTHQSMAMKSLKIDKPGKTDNELKTDNTENNETIEDTDTAQENTFERRVQNYIQMNDLMLDFSETPLLLIMIIHIIAGKVANPLGDLKEVNVTKLTTIIRMVITCLESRYSQKRGSNESLKSEIKDLEDKLEKLAFDQKMNVGFKRRDKWDNFIGKEYVEIALSIGLIKLSKTVSGDVSQIAELASSSYTGITFYHPFFQEFLAAQHVLANHKENKDLEMFLQSNRDDKTIRLLQFMFGSNHPQVDKVLKTLLDSSKMWNNLIDCMFEVADKSKVTAMTKSMSKHRGGYTSAPVLNVKYLNRKFHQNALANFCNYCTEDKIDINRMVFQEECSVLFVEKVPLPKLKCLEFLEMSISEKAFVTIIKSLVSRKYPDVLQFVTCELPESLSDDSKNTVKTVTVNKNMKIYRKTTRSQNQIWISSFDADKGDWGSEWLSEKQ